MNSAAVGYVVTRAAAPRASRQTTSTYESAIPIMDGGRVCASRRTAGGVVSLDPIWSPSDMERLLARFDLPGYWAHTRCLEEQAI